MSKLKPIFYSIFNPTIQSVTGSRGYRFGNYVGRTAAEKQYTEDLENRVRAIFRKIVGTEMPAFTNKNKQKREQIYKILTDLSSLFLRELDMTNLENAKIKDEIDNMRAGIRDAISTKKELEEFIKNTRKMIAKKKIEPYLYKIAVLETQKKVIEEAIEEANEIYEKKRLRKRVERLHGNANEAQILKDREIALQNIEEAIEDATTIKNTIISAADPSLKEEKYTDKITPMDYYNFRYKGREELENEFNNRIENAKVEVWVMETDIHYTEKNIKNIIEKKAEDARVSLEEESDIDIFDDEKSESVEVIDIDPDDDKSAISTILPNVFSEQ